MRFSFENTLFSILVIQSLYDSSMLHRAQSITEHAPKTMNRYVHETLCEF